MRARHELTAGPDTVLLWDADGNLFPSEEPAFDASTDVVNRMLEELGSDERWTSEALRSRSMGMTFRFRTSGWSLMSTASTLLRSV